MLSPLSETDSTQTLRNAMESLDGTIPSYPEIEMMACVDQRAPDSRGMHLGK